MSLSPFRRERRGPGPWVAALITALLHLGFAGALAANPESGRKAAKWVEMAVAQKPPPPPPPEPPPPPPPEEKPKPKPKPVEFEELEPVEPTPEPPIETEERPVRRIQGLSANSFVAGGSTGLTVRAGTTTAVAAGPETMSLGDAAAPRAYTAVKTQPRRQFLPTMDVPPEARKAGIEGEIRVALDISAEGRVTDVRVLKGLGYGLDEACIEAWKKSRWKPAAHDGVAVAVLGVPDKCTVIATE